MAHKDTQKRSSTKRATRGATLAAAKELGRAKTIEAGLPGVLQGVFNAARAQGVPARAISRAFTRVAKGAVTKGSTTPWYGSDLVPAAATVLEAWRQDPDYLDPEGEALRLRADGPAPSMTTLVQKHVPTDRQDAVLSFLIESRTVHGEGDGRFAPRKAVRLKGTVAMARAAYASEAFLRTLFANVDTEAGGCDDGFEAEAFAIRPTAITKSALTRHLEKTAWPFLTSESTWLDSQPSGVSGASPELGMWLFAYEMPARPLRDDRKSSERPRAGTEKPARTRANESRQPARKAIRKSQKR